MVIYIGSIVVHWEIVLICICSTSLSKLRDYFEVINELLLLEDIAHFDLGETPGKSW